MIYLEALDAGNIDVFQPFIPEVLQVQALTDPGYMFFGIVYEDEGCGMIAVDAVGDNVIVKYMYLLPERRSSGTIDAALSRLLIDLYQDGYASVQMDYIPSEYQTIANLAERFSFKKYKTDRAYFSFRVADIRNCKAMSYNAQGILRLRALPARLKDDLFRLVEKSGYGINRQMIESDVRTMELSLVYMEGEKPRGLLLVRRMSENYKPGSSAAFGRIFPETSAADIALIYVGSKELKVPLYLLSSLCRNILKDFEQNDLITGYFPEGHITRLLEGALGIKGQHEETAILDLSTLQRYLDEEEPDLVLEDI